MEKNANANANANVARESSPSGEIRSPMAVASPPRNRNDDNNNPPPTVVDELSSVSEIPPPVATTAAAPESATTTADTERRQAVDAIMLDVGTSNERGVLGGGPDAEQGKKRGRGGDGGEQQLVVRAAKKKGELTEVPKGEPRCATCNKVFKSWKALFGHLRSHPERTYRGALPPPTAAELDIRRCQQQLASTLLTVAQQVAASRRGLDIDLNQPSSTAADDGASPDKTGGMRFDLNVEPPPESDEED